MEGHIYKPFDRELSDLKENLLLLGKLVEKAINRAITSLGERNDELAAAVIAGDDVFLFALTETESAQPRALFGGHLGAAAIGILCFQLFGDGLWVSVAADVLTMVYMIATHTIHPPAGANPLIMVHNHAGISSMVLPVGVGVLVLFLTALLWCRVRPGKQYPTKWW